MKKAIAETILNVLKETCNIEGFLGGSVRFGYDTPNSDIDIFVDVKHDNINVFQKFCNTYGFISVPNISHGYPGALFKNGNIHICALDSEIYSKEIERHKELSDIIKTEVMLLEFIQNLKKKYPTLRGSIIYNALTEIFDLD